MGYHDLHPMTEISARQFDFVTQENLSPREAVSFLRNAMQLRTFADILKQICGAEDREGDLVAGLCALDPDAKPDSVRRKVRNWMNGKSIPTIAESYYNHLLTFAAEESRLTNRIVDMDEYIREIEAK